jgi:mannose-6-phosphate isomerase
VTGTSSPDQASANGGRYSTTGVATRVEKPWGYEILWTQPDRPYVGKLLHVDAGKRMSLQVHDAKTESWFLVAGRAKVVWDDGSGELVETELERGLGYSCQIGQRHRLVGITDCDIIEVSTPEIGTTHRLEDDYSRPDETDAVRSSPGRGWTAG